MPLATALFCGGLVAVATGCKKAEYQQPHLQVAPLPPSGIGSGTGSGGPGAPPGTAELFEVPTEIAARIKLERVVTGLARPVALVTAPGDVRKRMFVVLQHVGEVRAIEHGVVATAPFLKIPKLATGNEQGLLGLAFHPKFAENGKLYVNFTSSDYATHIVEYRVVSPNGDAVDPASAREVFTVAQPYSNHNGGNLVFGPRDGKLYTGMGDGGSAGDPNKNGQNPGALLVKILRFDVDDPKAVAEIVHVGVRNPWRFSFDTNGDLYLGDVGQNLWENVYVVSGEAPRVHNFGWNVVEGNHCFERKTCERAGFTPPVADYSHEQGCSVTGGVVYRGTALPALVGRYFYADYCTGLLRSFRWTRDPSSPTSAGFARDHWEWKPSIDKDAVLQEISSFGVDAAGELYLVELTGSIYKLVPN
ncbi:MAG: PQQ-dependent sugar dehydrogenase [Proteobacteria bacterium]|nr:PQQ-dependent sugar dehydrogenase [Pseudomonadota bacterium]